MAGEYQRSLLKAYRSALERLDWEGWEGDLEEAIAESPEVETVHTLNHIPEPALTPEQQRRVDKKVQELLAELL